MPIPKYNMEYVKGISMEYNKAAEKILAEKGVYVNNVHAYMLNYIDSYMRRTDFSLVYGEILQLTNFIAQSVKYFGAIEKEQ